MGRQPSIGLSGLMPCEAYSFTSASRCLASFAQTLKASAPMQVRAVATQTLREARNRDQFLVRAEAALGHPIEVISGREEARLDALRRPRSS